MKRFFLVENIPFELNMLQSTYMEVSYLCMNPAVVMVQKGNEFYLGEIGNVDSFEFDVKDLKHIEPGVYGALLTAVKATAVKLMIYELILENGIKIELNKYEEENDGKMIASINFENSLEANSFEVPDWLGKEISSKNDYKASGFVLKNKKFV